jgi:hypothetical protein
MTKGYGSKVKDTKLILPITWIPTNINSQNLNNISTKNNNILPVFESVVEIFFKSIFYSEMHQNNIFLFF